MLIETFFRFLKMKEVDCDVNSMIDSFQRFYIYLKVLIKSFMCSFCKINNLTFTRLKTQICLCLSVVENINNSSKLYVCLIN